MEIQLYKALVLAGVPESAASDVVESLEKELRERIRDARADLVTGPILDAKLEATKVEIIKWNIGSILAATGLALAAAKLLH